MNIQIKQKIIGIVVILIFLAIAIPFLFSGSKNPQPNNTSTSTSTEVLNLPPNQQTPNQQESVIPKTNTDQTSSLPIQITNTTDDVTKNVSDATTPKQLEHTTTIATNNINQPTTLENPGFMENPTETQNDETQNEDKEMGADEDKTSANMQITPVNSAQPTTTNVTNRNPALQASLAQKETAIVSNTAHKTAKSHKTKTPKVVAQKPTVTKTPKVIAKKTPKIPKAKEISPRNTIASDIKQQWLVDVGIYKNADKAQSLLKKLQANKYHATIQTELVKDTTLYRVVLVPVTSKEKAENLAKKVAKNFGVKTKIIEEQITVTTKNKLKTPTKLAHKK